MDQKLRSVKNKLKKEGFDVDEREWLVFLALMKQKHGLYTAEVAREADLYASVTRKSLRDLEHKGLLECKEVETLSAINILHGYKLRIPEGCRVVSSKDAEVIFARNSDVKISETDTVIDKSGFRIPVEWRPRLRRHTIFRIRESLFEILSQK